MGRWVGGCGGWGKGGAGGSCGAASVRHGRLGRCRHKSQARPVWPFRTGWGASATLSMLPVVNTWCRVPPSRTARRTCSSLQPLVTCGYLLDYYYIWLQRAVLTQRGAHLGRHMHTMYTPLQHLGSQHASAWSEGLIPVYLSAFYSCGRVRATSYPPPPQRIV